MLKYASDNLHEYMTQCPGQSSFRRDCQTDNPKEFFAYNHYLFLQESDTEALVFFQMRDNEVSEIYAIVHLELDLVNLEASIDDIYFERYEDGEFISKGREMDNEMCDMFLAINTIKGFLGYSVFKVIDSGKRGQKITGSEWEKYEEAYRSENYQ